MCKSRLLFIIRAASSYAATPDYHIVIIRSIFQVYGDAKTSKGKSKNAEKSDKMENARETLINPAEDGARDILHLIGYRYRTGVSYMRIL